MTDIVNYMRHVDMTEILRCFSPGKSGRCFHTAPAHGASIGPVVSFNHFAASDLQPDLHGISAVARYLGNAVGIVHMRCQEITETIPGHNKEKENKQKGDYLGRSHGGFGLLERITQRGQGLAASHLLWKTP